MCINFELQKIYAVFKKSFKFVDAMRDDQYKFKISGNFDTYEFVSKGPKGQIPKIVKYTEMDRPNFYNLGFGDKIGNTDDFDDSIVSDNKDMVKILATVASTVYEFTSENLEASIFVRGNTAVRSRLYQMSISNNLTEILKDFAVLGMKNNDEWQMFQKNQNYKAFLITRKWNLK